VSIARLFRRVLPALVGCLLAARAGAGPFDQVKVEPSKTSIYVGSVALALDPLSRRGGSYEANYKVTVFPFFFYNEVGQVSIDLSDADLEHLAKGETVEFTGHAQNSAAKPRTISGRAVPTNATEGKIKVRIGSKSPKIELIFNTHYAFASP
jgi:hypothetical protein